MEEIPSSNLKEVRRQKVVNLNIEPLMVIAFMFKRTRLPAASEWTDPKPGNLGLGEINSFFFLSFISLLLESHFVWLDLA